jgi:hypothetical protein
VTASTAARRARFTARLQSRRTRVLALTVVVLTTVATLAASGVSGGAAADPTIPPGTAVSQAAEVDAGAISVSPSVTLLGGAIDGTALLGSLTTALVNPLLALPNALTSNLAGSLVGAGLQANSPTGIQPRPTSGYPTCGQSGWTSADCYGPLIPAVSAPGLVTLNTGVVQGYATHDTDGYIASTQAANPVLSLLGITLGNLGVTSSSAQCGKSTGCTATHSLTGGSLFGGGLTYSIAGGNILASVGGAQLTSVPLNVISGVTAALTGNLLKLNISLTLTQLLGAIGTTLSALTGLLGVNLGDSSTTLSLTVTVGPGDIASTGSSTSSAWGLDVSVDLTGSIGLGVNVLGLNVATIKVNIGRSNVSSPDLLDLKLAYSAAATNFIPPALI